MKKVGELPGPYCLSHKVVHHKGRTLCFNQSTDGELVVYELALGEESRISTIFTEMRCINPVGCCALGDQILVMSGRGSEILACLISVGDGPVTPSNTHFASLKVNGGGEWSKTPFLHQVSRNRALLYFAESNAMWTCDRKGKGLTLAKLAATLPYDEGVSAVPIRLPNGKLLVAGSLPWSTDITILDLRGNPTFRRAGDLPGAKRTHVSCALVKGRFVIGFGGWNGSCLDDLWIFDIKTRNSSVVWKSGEWHPGGALVPLVVQGDALYLIGGLAIKVISSITLQALSELIHDDTVRNDFCLALGLSRVKKCNTLRPVDLSPGMKKLEGSLWAWRSSNTIRHRGRVFHFSQDRGELVVSELVFGPRLGLGSVHTGLDCKVHEDWLVSCCSVGDEMLVMAGEKGGLDCFAALVSVEAGRFGPQSVSVAKLIVRGGPEWQNAFFLVQIGEGRVWLSFANRSEIWICTIQGSVLKVQKSASALPTARGFGAPPIPLSEGKLLVAGANPLSSDITLIASGNEFTFNKIGNMPGKERYAATLILVGGRFVIGFGGWGNDFHSELWVFDLLTRTSSSMKKEGDWHPAAAVAFLEVREETLYVIGGNTTDTLHSISLLSLLPLIENDAVRGAFFLVCLKRTLPRISYVLAQAGDRESALRASLNKASSDLAAARGQLARLAADRQVIAAAGFRASSLEKALAVLRRESRRLRLKTEEASKPAFAALFRLLGLAGNA